MEKIILSILLFGITIPLHAQWMTSQFFLNENKSEYTVSLQTTENYPLSKEDTKTLIDILSAYTWEEFRIIKQQGIETWPEVEDIYYNGDFNYRFTYCNIVITHLDKRKVTLQINRWGDIIEPYFLIECPNKKPYKDLIRCNLSFYSWNIEKIKQLFLKNDVNFNNLAKNEIVKIKPVFSFYDVFSELALPTAPVDTALSKQFIRLYNAGWDKGIDHSKRDRTYYSSGDGKTLYSLRYLYVHHNVILTSIGLAIDYFSNHNFDFKEADTPQKLTELVNSMLKGHNGEGEQILSEKTKIYYQYKDGQLHGQVRVYSLDGKLTDEATFDKGLPTNYIKYANNGIKEKEICFVPGDTSLTWANLTWAEYDEKGNVKDSGKSQIYYQGTAYGDYDDFQNFYKTKK